MSKPSRRPGRACRTNRGVANERTHQVVECMLDICSAPATFATIEIHPRVVEGVATVTFVSVAACDEHTIEALDFDAMSINGPIDDEHDFNGLKAIAETTGHALATSMTEYLQR